MLMGARCESCVAWMRMPRKRRRHTNAWEKPDLSLIFQPTSKVLSQKRVVWVFARLDVRHSSARQLKTIPASSRSLIVMMTALDIYFIFCVHYSCQMIGPILFKPYVQNPPMPIPQLTDVVW